MANEAFLRSVGDKNRPEPNVVGGFDCMECRAPVDQAHYDRTAATLTWYCPDGHKSVMKEVAF